MILLFFLDSAIDIKLWFRVYIVFVMLQNTWSIVLFELTNMRIKCALTLVCMTLFLPFANLFAHEPLFMMSHEAPGKEAFDIHTAFSTNSLTKEKELELEFTYGITRDFAIRFGAPLISKIDKIDGERTSAMGNPIFNMKWRFWDNDLPGKKYAVAWALNSTLPIGDSNKNIDGSIYPVFESGFSTGMESVKFYYFFDIRYRYYNPRPAKPGDRIFLDFAPGWRPRVGKLEDIDVVLFLEFNYVHIKRSENLIANNQINDNLFINQQGNPELSAPLNENYRISEDRSLIAEFPRDRQFVFDSSGLRQARFPIGGPFAFNQTPELLAEFRVNPYYTINHKGEFLFRPEKKQDRVNNNTGGDALFISPDILISTSNRLMFRFGVQIPVWKNLRSRQKVGTTMKLSIETRF